MARLSDTGRKNVKAALKRGLAMTAGYTGAIGALTRNPALTGVAALGGLTGTAVGTGIAYGATKYLERKTGTSARNSGRSYGRGASNAAQV